MTNIRTVTLMVGLPGMGKSTMIEEYKKTVTHSVLVVSTDEFFMRNNKYEFDAARLGEAHAWCLRSFINTVKQWNMENDEIIVDNTNLTMLTRAPYIAVAKAFEWDVRLCILRSPAFATQSDEWFEKLAARNVHGVPAATIKKMALSAETYNTPFDRDVRIISELVKP